MKNKIHRINPHVTNPDDTGKDQAPADPSNTSNIGQSVEQGVIKIKEGISEQSSEWEDKLERNIPNNSGISDKAENDLKDPSPEEKNMEDKQQQ